MKLLGTYTLLAIISINTGFASMGSIGTRHTAGEMSSSVCKDNQNFAKRVVTKADLDQLARIGSSEDEAATKSKQSPAEVTES